MSVSIPKTIKKTPTTRLKDSQLKRINNPAMIASMPIKVPDIFIYSY